MQEGDKVPTPQQGLCCLGGAQPTDSPQLGGLPESATERGAPSAGACCPGEGGSEEHRDPAGRQGPVQAAMATPHTRKKAGRFPGRKRKEAPPLAAPSSAQDVAGSGKADI